MTARDGARPTVVHVITMLELGGAQQNTIDTCRLLDRGRFNVALLSGPGGMLDPEAARVPDLDFRIVADLARDVRPVRDLRAFRSLRDHLREMRGARDDVIVHTHSSKAGILGRFAAAAAGVRHVVHTVHGFGHPAFRSRWSRRVAIAAERAAARRTSHVVAVSQANVAEGRALRLFGDAEVSLIRSGFDVAAFRDAGGASGIGRVAARRELGLDPARPVVGTIACLKPQKAPGDFVRVVAAVRRERPDAQFVLAGDGELREAVEAFTGTLELGDSLRLLGWRDDVPRVLAALDVFVLTSRWEGLPRAVVQAMAAGVPVVATAADGVRDVVDDGRTGFLRPVGDVGGLARGVLDLLASDELREHFAAAASAQVDAFDVHRMVRELEALYERMLRDITPRARHPPGLPGRRRS